MPQRIIEEHVPCSNPKCNAGKVPWRVGSRYIQQRIEWRDCSVCGGRGYLVNRRIVETVTFGGDAVYQPTAPPVPRRARCANCRGTGRDPMVILGLPSRDPCPVCHGSGQI